MIDIKRKRKERLGTINFNCDNCHKESNQVSSQFNISKNHFCSKDCRIAYKRTSFYCENCNNLSIKSNRSYKIEKSHCCSKKCYKELRIKNKKKPYEIICTLCKKHFNSHYYNKKWKNHFCSRLCSDKYSRDMRYKDYKRKTPLRKLIKLNCKYINWQKSIYLKDDFKCCECDRNYRLHAHHLKHFADIFKDFLELYPLLNAEDNKEELLQLALNYEPFWDINNGQTLCEDCHQNKHPELKIKMKNRP